MKIGDFGLAAICKKEGQKFHDWVGTPNHTATEMHPANLEVGYSYEIDIWSLGVILYALLFGYKPFSAEDDKAVFDNIINLNYSFPD